MLLCQFHREDAWRRWLTKGEHGYDAAAAKRMKKLLQAIGNATTESELKEAMKRLKESKDYKKSLKCQTWLEKQWFPEIKVKHLITRY